MADKRTVEDKKQEKLYKICRQVDFYFGDSNFPTDKFLRKEAEKDEKGFVGLSVLMSFKRLKSISEDKDEIVEALEGSNVVELNDDKTMIRRMYPLPENDTSSGRTIYAKRFPRDSTLEELTQFFSQFGTVNCIRMRKMKGNFKGTATVEFEKEEVAKELVGRQNVFYKRPGAEEKMTEADESTKKEEAEGESIKQEEEEVKKEGEVAYDPSQPLLLQWKKDWELEKKVVTGTKRKRGEKDDEKVKAEVKKEATPIPEGCVLAVSNIPKDFYRGKVKDAIHEASLVPAYVEVRRAAEGEEVVSGFVRMYCKEDADALVKYLEENDVKFDDKKPEVRILEGSENLEYWEKFAAHTATNRPSKRGRGGRRGRGRGRRN